MSQEPGARRVHVRIGELVLDGFAPGERYRIGEAVRRELARLVEEQGFGRRAGPAKAAVVDAGSFPVAAGANAGAIGKRVAQSVHHGLAGGRGK